eukprot:15439310-Alexandrium_andersonii.AAC.1
MGLGGLGGGAGSALQDLAFDAFKAQHAAGVYYSVPGGSDVGSASGGSSSAGGEVRTPLRPYADALPGPYCQGQGAPLPLHAADFEFQADGEAPDAQVAPPSPAQSSRGHVFFQVVSPKPINQKTLRTDLRSSVDDKDMATTQHYVHSMEGGSALVHSAPAQLPLQVGHRKDI